LPEREPFVVWFTRELERVWAMPRETLEERKARADSLMAAMRQFRAHRALTEKGPRT